MPLNPTLDKTRKDLERVLGEIDKTPLYAVVGVGDLAVEKIRGARTELTARAATFDPQAFRNQAQATLNARVGSFQEDVKATPEQVKTLPTKAQAALAELLANALATYDVLAGRGKGLVTRVSHQQSTSDLHDQAKSTVARAKATTTTVKKQAAATKKSASSTVGTAKKSASKARTSAKATTTSAKKTATAAQKATSAAADKVGNGPGAPSA